MTVQHRRWSKSFYLSFIGIAIMLLACNMIGGESDSNTDDSDSDVPSVDVEATIVAGVAGTQEAMAIAQATIDAAIAATQAANTTQPTQPTPTIQPTQPVQPAQPNPASPTPLASKQDIIQIISNEVNGLVNRNMAEVQQVFSTNAIVIDRNGTPGNSDDDIIWNGWPNIEQRYRALFSGQFTTLTLVELSVEFIGDNAIGRYKGIMVDDVFHADNGAYTLRNEAGQWQITQLELGNQIGYSFLIPQDDGRFVLELGSQHRYEEPWGWDKGDPCKAWQNGDWDDTKPNYRGFNLELLLRNNSDEKIPDNWPVRFLTANGQSVRACFYGYKGSGPPPGASSSMTFFTVVEKGDYVDRITFEHDGQTLNVCLDGTGEWWRCEEGR
ncbi:MAG: nuclear transport factor 2 family protein [Chloroflexota bacterium]